MIEGRQVLWLDNDPAYIKQFVMTLEEDGYSVVVKKSVTEAERLLQEQRFDLVIVDVMIPTVSQEEEQRYPPAETDNGHKTGLVFFRKVKLLLADKQTSILVLTVRIDEEVRKEFLKEGLPEAQFVTKMDVMETPKFMKKIESLLGEASRARRTP
jgi:CheY-like chemotaxis protein